MRASDASGCARVTDDVAARDPRARHNADAREMREQREDTEAVIDDHGIPREIQVLRKNDASCVGRMNGRPRGGAEVRTLMAARRLAVEDRQPAESAVRLPRNWRIES